MPAARARRSNSIRALPKSPIGLPGLDEITGGGLPKGRPTLVTGGAGCGKTLLSMEFLIRGATKFDEPGLFVSFEENEQELRQNVASLGFDLADLVRRRRLSIDFVQAERSEIEEAGDYDLEGLFLRLGHAIDHIQAKRVVLDTIEALFAAMPNSNILRAELRRLFRWLKDRGVTAIVTAERGDGMLTRHGLEEYVSDCVILLDHRVIEQVSTRWLRVVKYRGSFHGTNEYPFLIDETGISVLPITSLGLHHEASAERMLTGIERLDSMLGGKGLFRGSSVLISGTPGSGKTSLASHIINAACARGERCLYWPLEESQQQILRNMMSVGLDLSRWVTRGLLRYHATRPSSHGLEMHLAVVHKLITAFQPAVVVVDPLSNLRDIGTAAETKAMLTRLIDFLKSKGITALFTSLTSEMDPLGENEVGISSLMDTWLAVRNLEHSGERTRGLYILKSRGMNHSNQIREFSLTDHGVELREVYIGPAGVLTGSARAVQESREQAAKVLRHNEISRNQRELSNKRQAMEAQVASLRAAFEAEAAELEAVIEETRRVGAVLDEQRPSLESLSSGEKGNGNPHEKREARKGGLRQRSGSGNGRKERSRLDEP